MMKEKTKVCFFDEKFGDDSDDGKTPETAKRTISACRLKLGDSAIVVPTYGTYFPVLGLFKRVKGWEVRLDKHDKYFTKSQDVAEIISRLVYLEGLLKTRGKNK
jgi:hypothetical protein